MGNIGDAITPSVPAVGAAGPQYATDIDAILNEVVTRLSTKVPLSSLAINGDLSLGGNSLTNAAGVVFSSLSVAPSGSPFNRWASFGGDVYWISPAGAVQVTTGATLNSAAVGGITGAYGGANPAQLRYDNVNTRYDLYANFGTNTWAYCRALGFDIPGGATSTAFARLQWGGGANITLTLPATLPAANQLLTVDNTGAITAGISAAMASNANITLAGTGTYKHGTKTIHKAINSYDGIVLSGSIGSIGSTRGISISSASQVLIRLPELPTHYRLINVTVGFAAAIERTGVTAQVVKWGSGDPYTTALTNVGSALSNTGTARMQVTGLNAQPSSGETYWLSITTTTGGANPGALILDFDVP